MLLQDYFTEMEDRTSYLSTVTTDKNKMIRTANDVLKRIYTKFKLVAERDSSQLTTVEDTHTYYLDPRVMSIINMRMTDNKDPMDFMSREKFEKEYTYPATTETGEPSIYVPIRKLRVSAQPAAASTISIVSTSASDATTYYVVVNGISGGVRKTERLTLTGLTPVVSTNSYTKVLSISKDETVGTITATAGAVTIVSLMPLEKFKECWEVRFHLIPNDAYVIEYTFQTIPWLLANDEDYIPMNDEYASAFLAQCTADLLFKQGDQKYQFWDSKGISSLIAVEDNNMASEESDLVFGFPELEYEVDD